jgi:dipeptidyl aminopeptidase/acylaminoacyl peptidase
VLVLALAALALAGCPSDASLGKVTFVRGGAQHEVSLSDCVDRRVGKAAAPRERPDRIVSPDRRYAVWSRPVRSNSIAADGLQLYVSETRRGGRTVPLGTGLAYPDYQTWCGSTLVFVGGGNRLAVWSKRLLVAQPPDWRPRPLWRDARRAFGSVTCAPDGEYVAVLSQPAVEDYHFFHTRWQLWRVGFDGTRSLLDAPPQGWADESPRWSRDERSLLFVRERQGHGQLMLWRGDRVTGPIVELGYSLGYYGHHDWWTGATWSASG